MTRLRKNLKERLYGILQISDFISVPIRSLRLCAIKCVKSEIPKHYETNVSLWLKNINF